MLKNMYRGDIKFIIDCCKAVTAESAIANSVPQDEEHVGSRLAMMFNNGMYGLRHGDKGFMLVMTSDSWYDPTIRAYELMLYVKPEHRGGRVATILIRKMEELIQSFGVKDLTVGASLGIKDRAVEKLYERLGYKWKGNSLVKEFNV